MAWWMVTALIVSWAAAAPARAEPPKKPPKKDEPAAPKTLKVTKAPFRVEVKLSGVFEAARTAEVVLRPKAWSQLRVREVVAHGAAVKKGQVLLACDTKKIEKAVRDKAAALALGELALKQAQEELRHLEVTTPAALAAADRRQKRAAADLEHFRKVARPLAEKEAHNSLKYRTDVLEYTKEELRQLLKMYKADDLTEETEEIVLKRQRNAVQRAEFSLEREKIAHKRQLEVVLPRQAEDLEIAQRNNDEAKKSKDALLPLALRTKRLEVAKAQIDRARAVKALGDLKADLAAMTVKAPMAGVVYYGRCVRGKWSAATVAPKLVPRGTLAAETVLMTVVDPKELLVRVTVPEKELHRLRKGLTGTATPTGFPDRKLKVRLASPPTVPLAAGGFDTALAVLDKPGPVRPGMTCRAALTAYERKDVVTVPASAVFAEPGKPAERFVYLKTPGKPQKRVVKVGRTLAGKTEILEGLRDGEVIFLAKPK